MASQTRDGVSGMSACRTPNGANASTTAFTTAGRRSDGGRFADALGADRVMRRRRHGVPGLQMRHLERGRDQVVHQRPAQAVALLVEGDHLHQRHADAVDDAAVHLALDDHRVDPGAAVVDGQEAPHLDHRGARIDVHHTEVRAVGVGQVLRVVADLGVEPALDAVGQIAGAVRAHRDVLDGHRRRRVPLDVERALLPLQVGDRNLEHARRDDLGLVAHLAGHQCGGRTRDRCRPAAVGAQPERRLVGVAVHHLDVVGRDAQLLGDDLSERRLVALALGLDRKPHNGFARRVHAQLAAVGHAEAEDVHVLARAGADGLGEEGHPDAHQLAARAPLLFCSARSAS